jgi:hypothetical protein
MVLGYATHTLPILLNIKKSVHSSVSQSATNLPILCPEYTSGTDIRTNYTLPPTLVSRTRDSIRNMTLIQAREMPYLDNTKRSDSFHVKLLTDP